MYAMEEMRRRMVDIVQFLSDHRWIYDIQITRLFADQWWKTIPSEVAINLQATCMMSRAEMYHASAP